MVGFVSNASAFNISVSQIMAEINDIAAGIHEDASVSENVSSGLLNVTSEAVRLTNKNDIQASSNNDSLNLSGKYNGSRYNATINTQEIWEGINQSRNAVEGFGNGDTVHVNAQILGMNISENISRNEVEGMISQGKNFLDETAKQANNAIKDKGSV